MGESLRLVIVGGGAVGQVTGRPMVDAVDLTFVDPSETARNQCKSFGARAIDPYQAASLQWSEVDLVLIATKAGAVADALRVVPCSTTTIALCNGLRRDGSGRQRQIMHGVVEFAANLTEAGQPRVTRKGPLWLPRCDLTNRLRARCQADLLRLRLTDDIVSRQWSKLVLNAAVEPLAAAAGYTYGSVFGDRAARAVLRRLLSEAMEVAHASGVAHLHRIQGAHPRLLAAVLGLPIASHLSGYLASRTASDVQSTMLNDVRAGRRTEIDHLCGFVAETGTELGLDVPTHRRAVQIIRSIERGDLSPDPRNIDRFTQPAVDPSPSQLSLPAAKA